MTAREELVAVISTTKRREMFGSYIVPKQVAEAILAAGYRKPRTITTAEELDALPAETVIRASNGDVFEKQHCGPWYDGPHDWQSFEGTFWNGETLAFPATVLYEPAPQP